LGTQEYARIRMGIGNDFGRGIRSIMYLANSLMKRLK